MYNCGFIQGRSNIYILNAQTPSCLFRYDLKQFKCGLNQLPLWIKRVTLWHLRQNVWNCTTLFWIKQPRTRKTKSISAHIIKEVIIHACRNTEQSAQESKKIGRKKEWRNTVEPDIFMSRMKNREENEWINIIFNITL